ncbi:hypothetical protein Tco_0920097 [Tanacetum coccineum]
MLVKALACWVWKPKYKVLDNVSKHNSASITIRSLIMLMHKADPVSDGLGYPKEMNFLKLIVQGNPQMDLQDKGVVDSGCLRHMIGNMSYLTGYKEIDGGYVAFGGNPKGGKITGKDQLGKFDGKADEGFFVCENTPNIAGSRPNWLFDIDALTKSMNYKPVITGNQSNGNAGTKACDDAGKARMEIVPGKNYILLPLWHVDPSFSQNSKSSPDVGFKPLGDNEKKVTKEPGKEGGDSSNDQEKED